MRRMCGEEIDRILEDDSDSWRVEDAVEAFLRNMEEDD